MSTVQRIAQAGDAQNLASRLLSLQHTDRPILLISSTPSGHFYLDPDEMAAQVGDGVEVVGILTGEATRAFGDAMPPLAHLYGGASRVYGTDRAWVEDPRTSRLRMCFGNDQAHRVRAAVLSDVARVALERPSPQPATTAPKTAAVANPSAVPPVNGAVTRLLDDLTAVRAENEALRAENIDLRGKLTRAVNKQPAGKKKVTTVTVNETVEADLSAFADPDDQFRHEIYLEWARRILPGEKPDYPLVEYTLGPDFLATIEVTGGISREKVVQVVVEVVTGRAKDMPQRALHYLTQGETGPPVTRSSDGAICWRVYLESHTASARRLHFWRLDGGGVELSRVGLHDDCTP